LDEKRYAEAERLLRQTLEIERRVLGPEHRFTLVTAGNLGETLTGEGQYPEAEKLIRETLEIKRRTLGQSHKVYLASLYALGSLLQYEKRYPEAELVLTAGLEGLRRVVGDAHPKTVSTYYVLAEVLAQEGKRQEALRNLQSAMQHKLPVDLQGDLQNQAAFRSLHGDPVFEALAAVSRKRSAPAGK
jgi:non-specific serine/threonine protein kinase/serine/threonine-protein kinase